MSSYHFLASWLIDLITILQVKKVNFYGVDLIGANKIIRNLKLVIALLFFHFSSKFHLIYITVLRKENDTSLGFYDYIE